MANSLTNNRLTLPSRLDAVDPAVDQIAAALETHGYPDRERFGLQMAIHEALINAVKHGNRLNPKKHVSVRYAITPHRVQIDIEDEGCGFQPDDLPDPTDPTNLDKPHGRGLLLMRAYMDQVTFNECGNVVHLLYERQGAA